MDQPIPQVSPSDVFRIINRDFAVEMRGDVSTLLESYTDNEPVRVRLAILKLAAGNVAEVRQYVAAACRDYRDVLAWAEYPEHMKKAWTDRIATEVRDAIISNDARQYQDWLKRP